jgi:hypothetical protein
MLKKIAHPKIVAIFLSLFLVSFACSTYPLKFTFRSKSWHDVETWSITIITSAGASASVVVIETVVFSIRPIDVFRYLSDEDDDFKEELMKYSAWIIKKKKKKRTSTSVWLYALFDFSQRNMFIHWLRRVRFLEGIRRKVTKIYPIER